jgi:hypothetical protein
MMDGDCSLLPGGREVLLHDCTAEPLRLVVDGEILKLVLEERFAAEDFTITSKGRCVPNRQLARAICLETVACCG